jgi:hypothetical protein
MKHSRGCARELDAWPLDCAVTQVDTSRARASRRVQCTRSQDVALSSPRLRPISSNMRSSSS